MAARKKSTRSRSKSSLLNKELFIFILILAIVAVVTYMMTYNAIMAKINDQIGTNPIQVLAK